ncbi:MAG: DUF1624 domain-containing protein [Nitrospirae bacterium]|nr:DUF1624 domain-containing protein [Nitrospirota bacterium]
MKNHDSPRLAALDAARGSAMLLVFVSHFLDEYRLADLPQLSGVVEFIAVVCKVATPTFFLVSGIILGYLHRAMGNQFRDLRIHLIDKALFLLTIGHLLIASFTAAKSSFSHSVSVGYVTDTLAFCAIGSLLSIPYTRPTTRLWCGIALYLVSWTSWYFWSPGSPIVEVLKGIFLGPQVDGTIIFYFPLLPWFGVHLIGSYLGEQFSKYKSSELYGQASKILARLSAGAVLVILTVKATYKMLVRVELLTPSGALDQFVSPYAKYPPGPTYLFFFGGLALLLISALLFAKGAQWFQSPMRSVERLGRNSLLAFLLQYLVYYTVLHWLVTKTSLITPMTAWAFFLLSIFGLVALVSLLDRHHIRRVWTVGLPRLSKYLTTLGGTSDPPYSSHPSPRANDRAA